MKSVQKPIRINPIKEKDLYAFIIERGTKPAVKFLFEFYQSNQNLVQNIVDKLKNEIDFAKPKTTIQSKQSNDFNLEDDFTSNF